MKIFFLMFLISVIHAWTPVPFDNDLPKIYGKWYVNAWMGNMDIPEDKKNQKIPPFVLKPISANKIEAKLNLKKNGRCEEIKLILQTTNEPGKMITWGMQIVGLLNIKVKDQMIIYIEGKMNGKNIIMMQLIGRNSDVNPEAFKIFEEFVRSKGQDVTKILKPGLEGEADSFT